MYALPQRPCALAPPASVAAATKGSCAAAVCVLVRSPHGSTHVLTRAAKATLVASAPTPAHLQPTFRHKRTNQIIERPTLSRRVAE